MNHKYKMHPLIKLRQFTISVLCLIAVALTTTIVSAQDDPEMAEFVEAMPDDSLIIAEHYIDSLPEKYENKKVHEIVEQYLKDYEFLFDELNNAEVGKVYYTKSKDFAKILKFSDRKVEALYAIFINEDRKITVRLYGREKINSKGKTWQIMGRRSKTAMLNWNSAFRKNLKKKFRITSKLKALDE
ncbi:MAG: hypothetical protein SGJ04_10450 [Bacteroidota bacterium]|nr:hypothetical protein [Bacteroidota bacterium]